MTKIISNFTDNFSLYQGSVKEKQYFSSFYLHKTNVLFFSYTSESMLLIISQFQNTENVGYKEILQRFDI